MEDLVMKAQKNPSKPEKKESEPASVIERFAALSEQAEKYAIEVNELVNDVTSKLHNFMADHSHDESELLQSLLKVHYCMHALMYDWSIMNHTHDANLTARLTS